MTDNQLTLKRNETIECRRGSGISIDDRTKVLRGLLRQEIPGGGASDPPPSTMLSTTPDMTCGHYRCRVVIKKYTKVSI